MATRYWITRPDNNGQWALCSVMKTFETKQKAIDFAKQLAAAEADSTVEWDDRQGPVHPAKYGMASMAG